MAATVKHAASIVAALSLSLAATPVYARHELPLLGGPGDAGAQVECPPNQLLVGFSGRSGLWIDRIQAVCAPRGGQPTVFGGQFGGVGGGARDSFCPRGWIMLDAWLKMTTRNRQVSQISFTCRSVQTGETTPYGFGSQTYQARCPGFGVGDCAIDPATDQRCPPDELPIGFNVRYGKDVNAIGVICGRRP